MNYSPSINIYYKTDMIKTILFLSLLALSLTLSIPHQASMMEKKSRIEKLLFQFVELGEMSTEFDFSKLFSAIDELTLGLKQAEKDEEDLFERDFQQYIEDQAFYSDLITFYKAEVALHTDDLRTLNNYLASYNDQLKARQEELENTRKQKDQLEERIRQNEIAFKKSLGEFNAAIDVVDQAISILSELRNNPSFIQTNHEQLSLLGLQMSEVSFKQHRYLYQPIVEILVQMAQNKLTDQEMLKKVLNMLQNLRNTLDGGRNALIANYNAEREANLQLLDQYNKKISSLIDEIIPALQDLIANTIEQIRVKTILLNDAQANLDDAIATLNQIEERWVKRRIQHKALMDEYEKELLLISQAVSALEKGGVKRN